MILRIKQVWETGCITQLFLKQLGYEDYPFPRISQYSLKWRETQQCYVNLLKHSYQIGSGIIKWANRFPKHIPNHILARESPNQIILQNKGKMCLTKPRLVNQEKFPWLDFATGDLEHCYVSEARVSSSPNVHTQTKPANFPVKCEWVTILTI